MSGVSLESKNTHYDLIRTISADVVCATEQWARIIRRTTATSPDPQMKLMFASDLLNAALEFYGIELPDKMKNLVIESAVDQRADRGLSGIASFGMLDFQSPDGPGKDVT